MNDTIQNDKIVLLCATGRSGSTTLQRIINTIPNSNICGENLGAINSLLDFFNKLHQATIKYVPGHYKPASYEEIISKNVKPSWYNSYQMSEIENHIRDLIVAMFKKDSNTNLWGFKEIRYDNKKVNLLKLFKQLFPQTKVIIQVRENIAAQSQSSWYKQDKNAPFFLSEMNQELYKFYNENRDWCYFTTFEKMFDKTNVQNIFSFIDCREKYDENKVDEVLKNNIKD
jgi:hypothetical protein